MLDAAQEAVGLVHLRHVIPRDVPTLTEPSQRVEGRAALQHLIGTAVDHLQQLDGELHVPQPARAELDVPFDLGAGDMGDHPAAHRTGVLDEALTGGGLPHPRLDHLLEVEPQCAVPGRGAGLQQRLELPGLRPFGVVAPVGGDGAHQGAVLALGAEVGIDLPQRSLTGALGTGPRELSGQSRTDRDHVLLDLRREPALAVVVTGGGDHVHHVDVGDVVELAGPGLSQGDHRPPHLLGAVDGGAGDRGGRLERRVGQVADRDRDPRLELGGVGGARRPRRRSA